MTGCADDLFDAIAVTRVIALSYDPAHVQGVHRNHGGDRHSTRDWLGGERTAPRARLLSRPIGCAGVKVLEWSSVVAGPGPGMCQYLGANYPVYYDCTAYQPWLPDGSANNPPAGSQRPASDCTGINIHNVGCA